MCHYKMLVGELTRTLTEELIARKAELEEIKKERARGVQDNMFNFLNGKKEGIESSLQTLNLLSEFIAQSFEMYLMDECGDEYPDGGEHE